MIGKLAKSRRCVWILRRGRQTALDARDRGVDQLQRLQHVDVPVEEQVDLRGSAAGHRSDVLEPGDGPDRLLDRPRDGDLHLLDRHHAVVDADDDAREIGRRKHGHREAQRFIDADDRQHADQEDDRLSSAARTSSVRVVRWRHMQSDSLLLLLLFFRRLDLHVGLRQHVSSSLASSNAPVVTTRWPF